jgi:hypothetical protein
MPNLHVTNNHLKLKIQLNTLKEVDDFFFFFSLNRYTHGMAYMNEIYVCILMAWPIYTHAIYVSSGSTYMNFFCNILGCKGLIC